MRIARIIPVTPATEIRGSVLTVRPCPATWPDGVHARHVCQYMITRYAPVAPLKDGWVEDIHDGPHTCSCGSELANDA